jgi:E3 ubiquitin-protein ligase UBR3
MSVSIVNNDFSFVTAYFTCIIKTMYNLLYYQIALQFCTRLNDEEVEEVIQKYSNAKLIPINGVGNLGVSMALIFNNLDRCEAFRQKSEYPKMDEDIDDDDDIDMDKAHSSKTTTEDKKNLETKLKEFEIELQSLCLPFLRNAALLRHHVYHHELPEIKAPNLEFARLVYFLELVTKSMDWKDFDATKALNFAKGLELALPIRWCEALRESRPPYDITRELITSQHNVWHQPQLLALPREYERLFTVKFYSFLMEIFAKILKFHFSIITNKHVSNVYRCQKKALFV